ncbi:MAG: glycosyltransferase [Bacteroidales bacterium]|nr:glycosyltransferase [Bacteroidales bacterium]
MKILFGIDAFQSHSNGTSISAQRYAETLRTMGHEVRIITNTESSYPDYIYPLKELKNPLGPLLHANGYQFASPNEKVIDQALDWCDIVHVYTPFFLGCKIKKMAKAKGKPLTAAFHVQAENISSAFHVGKVEKVNRMLYRFHYNTMYKGIQHIHCPSQMMADELKHYGYDNQLHVISNGISDDFVYSRPTNEKQSSDKIVITMVGRLSPEKRQDLIIKAVKMSKYEDRIQLQFAGMGPMEKKYRRLGKELTNPPIFGYYTREELIELLHNTHIYVHASDMESEAIGCIEAFATGLVPIISDSPLSATKQFALDERSLFKVDDATDLKNRIEYWIEHPNERKEMEIKYAQEAQKYRLTKVIRDFESMLEDAITCQSKV